MYINVYTRHPSARSDEKIKLEWPKDCFDNMKNLKCIECIASLQQLHVVHIDCIAYTKTVACKMSLWRIDSYTLVTAALE